MPFVNGQWISQQQQQQPTSQMRVMPQGQQQLGGANTTSSVMQNYPGVQQAIGQNNFRPPQQQPLNNPMIQQMAPQQNQLGAQQSWGANPNFGQAQGYAPQVGQSVEQGVQNNNPQSVQNFMSALNKVGAGSNNQFMNGFGQQGAGPQAGFQGFNQNGYMGMVGNGVGAGSPTGLNGYSQGGMGSQATYNQGGSNGTMNNQANNGGGYGTGQMYGNNNMSSSGQGKVNSGTSPSGNISSYGGYQTPNPWGNPANLPPGEQGSYFPNNDDGNSAYFNTTNANSPYQAQPGSFYSNQMPGYTAPNSNIPQTVSDVNAKTNITSGQNELQEFLDALGIYSYEYKDKANGEGRRISPMAQEIESTHLGKTAVSERPDGTKVVDYGKMAGAQWAALALLNHKAQALESRITALVSKKFNGV